MVYIHILRAKADYYTNLWCPYCDEVVPFGGQHYYNDAWCAVCNRIFPVEHQWPKGFDIKTGEIKKLEVRDGNTHSRSFKITPH